MFKRRLKTSLLVQLLGIFGLAGGLIILFFNLALNRVIQHQTQEAIEGQLRQLNHAYFQSDSGESSSRGILDATYMIVDDDFRVHYRSTSLDDQEGQATIDQLARYFQDRDDLWERDEERELEVDEDQLGDLFTIQVHKQTYRGQVVSYQGRVEDFYVRPAKAGEEAETYFIFAFADVTPFQAFIRTMNWDLIFILLGIGLVTVLVMVWTGQRLDRDFGHLARYISAVGQRRSDLAPPSATYQEVKDLVAQVEQMDHLIAANQRSQTLFFQNASHELRTPLMSIQGYAEALELGMVENSQEATGIILAESRKMGQLVDDILGLSKLEEGGGQLQLEELDVTDLLYDVTWRFKAKADQLKLSFVHDLQPGLTIQADEILLERALSNILSNALRYARQHIWVTSESSREGVRISLANDGPMIGAEEQARIFDRFYKGDGGQSGLGLAISREILQRLGGQLQVASDADKTVFTLVLPKSRSI